MNTLKKDILKWSISAFLIIASFFLWSLFTLKNTSLQSKNTKTNYVVIETKKDTIEIVSVPDGVSIIVDGEEAGSRSIELR